MIEPPNVFFFGRGRSPGHYWHGPGMSHVTYERSDGFPWKESEIEGRVQPGILVTVRYGRELVDSGSQAEGPAKLHHRDGWTLLSFWDRSGDKRRGSHGNFLAEGTHDFDAMVSLAREHFPSVVQRLTIPLRPEAP